MKKLLGLILLTFSWLAFADDSTMKMSNSSSSMQNMDNLMMYMDFGLGYGTASNWNTGSFALNAMTMGVYVDPALGVEIGMGMLPSGDYENKNAMLNSFHLAAKGILPLSSVFELYGKLGLGVNTGMGTLTSHSGMGDMEMSNMEMITPVNLGPYYGAGMLFNLSRHFGFYIENSGVIVIGGGNAGGFGDMNMTTAGLEIKM